MSSCLRFKDKPQAYGITLVELELSSETLGQLNSSIAAKREFPGVVKIRGKEYQADLAYAGKSTLYNYKKQYQIILKNNGGYNGKSTYRLNALGADFSGVRAKIGFYVYEKAGLMSSQVEHAAVYLNGKYLGLYALIEYVTEEFISARGHDVETMYKATLGNATFGKELLLDLENGFKTRVGPKESVDLTRLIELLNSPRSEETERKVAELVDIDEYLKYVMASIYIHNWDAFKNNFFLYRSQNDRSFHFIPWDLDHLFEQTEDYPYVANRTIWANWTLANWVFANETYKKRYLEFFQEFMNEVLPSEDFLQYVSSEFDTIAEAYNHDRVLTANNRKLSEQRETLISAIKDWHAAIESDLKQLLITK